MPTEIIKLKNTGLVSQPILLRAKKDTDLSGIIVLWL